MSVRVITPPTETVTAVDEAKLHLRIDASDEDDLVDALTWAAQGQIEATTQRRYCAQVLEWVRDCWGDQMVLPVAPGTDCSKITVVSVKYVDTTGALQTLDPNLYWVRPHGPTLAVVRRWFTIWPWLGDGAERVVIRFSIASTAGDAPFTVKAAAKLLIGHFYAHREAVVGVDNRDSSAPLPIGVEQLLNAERWD
ncbi:head-tail connector protein [Phenylobacterium sp.]|jgi:uncharacterized phiE125 gp8 family phage protein|uniref:head-tail connector protein n=1 Tax=Phenylobacterium sp. TaxID=1871053 RepID=UPI002F40F478